jgi:hypothetical protein
MKKTGEIRARLTRLRPRNRVLLLVLLLLVAAIIFIGLDDLPGYILAYLATGIIFFMATRHWQRARNYLVLLAASVFGIIFLSFWYVEIISRLAIAIGGEAAVEGLAVHIIELIFTYVILFGGPVGILFGIAGAIILGLRGTSYPKGNRSLPENT